MDHMRFEAPASVDAAVDLLAEGGDGARVLAGGTDLLVQLRSGMVEPSLVVDIKRLPEVREIAAEDGGFRVGAAVSGAELGEHAEFKALWPGVVEASRMGWPQRGTPIPCILASRAPTDPGGESREGSDPCRP